MDLDARLAAIERILANIDARITVNEELARRNVALTGHVAPEPQQPSADRLVTVRVTDESAELLANSCTFDMRAELKKARAVWRADAPALVRGVEGAVRRHVRARAADGHVHAHVKHASSRRLASGSVVRAACIVSVVRDM